MLNINVGATKPARDLTRCRTAIFATALLPLIAAAGCSADRSAADALTSLSPGGGKLTIGDRDFHRIHNLKCGVTEHITILESSQEEFEIKAMVSTIDSPTVKWVRLRDDSFAGSYTEDLSGEAEVSFNGAVYRIVGTATGFDGNKPPRPTTEDFVLDALC
ncbi:lipoprotein LpqH [Mycolicibacterium sp. XJ1819]